MNGELRHGVVDSNSGRLDTASRRQTQTHRFPVIVADPPWSFKDKGSRLSPDFGGAYETMHLANICDAGAFVQKLAADDAFLFLWAPHSMVLDFSAQHVAQAWGFEARQEIIWIKTTDDGNRIRFGAGHYARIATESLLLCRRGKAKVARHDMANVFFAPRTKHSEKPDKSYRYIEKLTGADSFLELYARRRYSERWTAWGDQLDG